MAEQMEGPWLSAGNPCKLHTVSNTTLCKTTFDSQGGPGFSCKKECRQVMRDTVGTVAVGSSATFSSRPMLTCLTREPTTLKKTLHSPLLLPGFIQLCRTRLADYS